MTPHPVTTKLLAIKDERERSSFVVSAVEEDRDVAVRATMYLFGLQTKDEQDAGMTFERNGKGVDKAHAPSAKKLYERAARGELLTRGDAKRAQQIAQVHSTQVARASAKDLNKIFGGHSLKWVSEEDDSSDGERYEEGDSEDEEMPYGPGDDGFVVPDDAEIEYFVEKKKKRKSVISDGDESEGTPQRRRSGRAKAANTRTTTRRTKAEATAAAPPVKRSRAARVERISQRHAVVSNKTALTSTGLISMSPRLWSLVVTSAKKLALAGSEISGGAVLDGMDLTAEETDAVSTFNVHIELNRLLAPIVPRVGDRITALLAGHDDWYSGVVLETSRDTYKVNFDDGEVLTVAFSAWLYVCYRKEGWSECWSEAMAMF
jgi:hypothetical protein